jgi:hypothetical protein
MGYSPLMIPFWIVLTFCVVIDDNSLNVTFGP